MSSPLTTDQPSLWILNGFIHNIQVLLSIKDNPLHTIPQSVIDLIYLFIGDLFSNEGSYTWKISDSLTVDKMLHAKNGEKFTSDPFIISRVKYQLEIYPNGNDPELSGYFVIYLRILSLPNYVENITIARIFRVLENKAGAGFVEDVSMDEPDYWTKKCPLSELIAINPTTITVQVDIMINKILLNDLSALNNYPLSPTILNEFQKEHHFEFTFDEKTMELIGNVDHNGFYLVKSFCADILNNQWYITIYPYGGSELSQDELTIDFGFYKLPRNARSISMKCRVYFDTDTIEEWEKSTIRPNNFSTNRYDIGHTWHCRLDTLKSLKTLTIKVDLTVTNIRHFDETQKDPCLIDDPVKIGYLLSQ